jgi:hypothetical protein
MHTYGEPSLLYYSRQEGWHFPEISFLSRQHPPNSQYMIRELESRRKEDARHLILMQYAFFCFYKYQVPPVSRSPIPSRTRDGGVYRL